MPGGRRHRRAARRHNRRARGATSHHKRMIHRARANRQKRLARQADRKARRKRLGHGGNRNRTGGLRVSISPVPIIEPQTLVYDVTLEFVPVGKMLYAVDSTGDGLSDAVAVDLNGDGQANATGKVFDSTGDGIGDSVGIDTTGDGYMDTRIRLMVGTGQDVSQDFELGVVEVSPSSLQVMIPSSATARLSFDHINDAIESWLTNALFLRHQQNLFQTLQGMQGVVPQENVTPMPTNLNPHDNSMVLRDIDVNVTKVSIGPDGVFTKDPTAEHFPPGLLPSGANILPGLKFQVTVTVMKEYVKSLRLQAPMKGMMFCVGFVFLVALVIIILIATSIPGHGRET